MTIEQSHGKPRPMLVRASDLQAAPNAEPERRRHRDPSGRFTHGNPGGLGRGATAPIRRMLGDTETTDAEARTVARDAARAFADALRDLPSDGATVRQMVALYSRHIALNGFWSAKAAGAGLGTDEGVFAQEQALKHGQRAERLAVTMTDLARVLAAKKDANAPFDPLKAYRTPKESA